MGSDEAPDVLQVWRAIEIYLRHAYPTGQPTATVRARLETLRSAGERLWESPAVEKQALANGVQYGIRLGNAWYPHMKLALERSPDGISYMLRVDTHDHHIRPSPSSPEFPAFRAMQERNSSLAAEIEAAWAEQSLLTFKEYLRRDLEHRTGHASA